jgi:CDP-diacylglycerol--glycerol-3-phosphate 3-phosphatidyltransferase
MKEHLAFGILAGITGAIIATYGVRTALRGRETPERVAREGATFLGLWVMEAFYWSFQGLGSICIKLGLHPNTLTWFSLLITATSLPCAACGHFSVAGILFLAGSVFDALDGLVARKQKSASNAGELFDAVIDRYADSAVLIGLILFYRASIWQMIIPLIALLGAFMMSYVRAKNESLGINLPSRGMRRHQRVAYLGAALIAGPEIGTLAPLTSIHHPITLAGVAFVGIKSNYAAVCLAIDGYRRLGNHQKLSAH